MKHINDMCCVPLYRDHQIAGTWQHLVCEVTGSKSLQMWYINKNKMCFSSSSGHPPKAIRGDHESTACSICCSCYCALVDRDFRRCSWNAPEPLIQFGGSLPRMLWLPRRPPLPLLSTSSLARLSAFGICQVSIPSFLCWCHLVWVNLPLQLTEPCAILM